MTQREVPHLTDYEIAHTLATIELNGKLTELKSSTVRTFTNYQSTKSRFRRNEALKAVLSVLMTCTEKLPYEPVAELPFREIAPNVMAQIDRHAMINVRKAVITGKRTARHLSEQQANQCCYCHGRMVAAIGPSQYTVEHLVERCRGGTDDLSNLVAACGPCNNIRGALMRPVIEFYLLRQRLIKLWPPCTKTDVHWVRITRMLMAAHDGLKDAALEFEAVLPKDFLMCRLPKTTKEVRDAE